MTIQFEKKSLLNLLRKENEHILDLLVTYNVPNSVDEPDCDNYLLLNDKKVAKISKPGANNIDELEDRLNTIRNKLKAKKRPMSDRAQKKREAKKLKKNKEFKKVIVSASKSMKNEHEKHVNGARTNHDSKKDIKPITPKPVFNEEGKMVFSKFDFAAHAGAKRKKSHQNPREILKKIKDTDRKINELKESGETEKAAELKNELAWKKAFDKIEGKKVKDDPKLLHKAIKKRKDEKKKSKQQWIERKKRVDAEIEQKQKKRQENLDKRSKDKMNTKLKKLSKRGRVVPGF